MLKYQISILMIFNVFSQYCKNGWAFDLKSNGPKKAHLVAEGFLQLRV